MKIIITTLFLTLSLNTFSQTYFQKYQPIADSLEKVYGIPSALMLAVAYHESAGGKSAVAKHSNNHFGIKGKNHKVKTKFKYFNSDTASYDGFCKLIVSKQFYGKLKNTTDVKKWVHALSKANYAGGSSTWPTKIISIIKKNNLV